MSQTIGIPQALEVLTPNAQWALTGTTYAGLLWLDTNQAKPTEDAVNTEIATLTAQEPFDECKQKASALLYETDWTTIADVADPAKSSPYLANSAEFNTYRNAVRQFAVYPVANPVFPTIPTAVWGT